MRKLPVAGPTYDYKLENIRNDIIEQELALCLKRQEDLAQNATIVDGDGNTTTLRANLDTEFYTRTEADTAIASATTSLVSETALNTALGDYTNTATLQQNFYTKTDADSAIATATTNLVSTTDLSTALGDYTNTATLEQNFYTKTDADSAISSAITTNNVSLGDTYGTIESVQAVEANVDGIEGKYAVKIDNNGHVSGFGLISTANNATPTSTFTVTADAFKIVDTSGAATPASPFEVYTSARVVDGVTVPAGVYMENANITAANIKTLDVDVINLDGVTLDTSGGQLIVKPLGIDTAQLADDSVSTVERQEASSQTQTANGAFNDIATVTISADTDDKFAVLARVQFFTFTGWTSTNVITLAINFGNQSYSDTISLIQASNNSYMHGFTFGGIFSANTSGSQNVTLTVAGGPVGGTGTMTVYGGAISVQRLVK